MRKRILYTVILILFIARSAFSTTYGFFVDGGYSPGSTDTDMDKMLDKRIDDAMDNMKDKDPNSVRKKYEHKKDLLDALSNLECKCGDEIVLFMVGHGSKTTRNPSAFVFSKDGVDLTPEELRKALTKAAKECCCKIHVVVFSCHSGMFIDELFKEEHVMSVYTSSSKDELSYSDAYNEDTTFVDGGDWIKGFNEDWKKDTNKTDMGKALQNSSESAREKMPYPPDQKTQTPQGWRRGEFEALAHVSERKKDKDGKIVKLKMHFYEPSFLRCTTREVDVKDVVVPADVDKCKWITFKVKTNKPGDPLTGSSDVVIVDPPTVNVLAHVEGIIDKKTLKVHIISPKWLYCNIIKLPVESPGIIPANVKVCNWIDVKIIVKNPDDNDKGFSTQDTIKPKDQQFKFKVHIEKVGKEKGIIEVHILEPPWYNCQNQTLQIPENERGKLAGLDKCSNLIMNITIHPDGTNTVSDIKVIKNAEGAKRFSLDASIQKPKPPLIDSTHTYQPVIGVTNTGLNTVSFPVYVAICKLSDKPLIENWWRTGEGEPTAVWHDVKTVNQLPFAETRIVNFSTWPVPPGTETYWMGFRAKLSGDENPASDTTSTVFLVSQSLNHAPLLQSGNVIPDSGGVTTTFTFRVTYIDVDNDEPVLHHVLIDNNSHEMIATGNNYSEGVIFGYQTTLTQGSHVFSFSFDDGHGHPVNSQVYSGPIVTQTITNHAPILQQGSVAPDSGSYYTPFVYRVLYIDQDNDAPTVYQAYIDNVPFNMNPTGNNFTEGVFFVLQRNLNPGNHTFYFRFDDGHGHMVTSQTYTGPMVH